MNNSSVSIYPSPNAAVNFVTPINPPPELTNTNSITSSVAQTNIRAIPIDQLPRGNRFKYAHPLYPNANYTTISTDDLVRYNITEAKGDIKIHFILKFNSDSELILIIYDILNQ